MTERKGDTSIDEAALDETVADVELAESLDQVERASAPPAQAARAASPARPSSMSSPDGDFDPEAHIYNVRNKQSIKKVVASDGGQFVLSVLAALVGVGVGIYAAFLQTTEWVVAACIITPASLIYAAIRWRLWLGQAPYLYRLLTSLGEDADDLLDSHRQKMVRKGRLPSDPTDER